jgi:hypothetical protein
VKIQVRAPSIVTGIHGSVTINIKGNGCRLTPVTNNVGQHVVGLVGKIRRLICNGF